MTKLNATCYSLQNGRIVEGKLSDFDRFIETTTRPIGCDNRYYVTQVDKDGEPTWALGCWLTFSGPEHIMQHFDSEEDAIAAAEDTYVRDILNNDEVFITLDRAEAERVLAEITED